MGAPPRREIRIESDMMEPLSHHTDAVLCGDFLYLSGAAPLDTAARVIAPGDVVKQCEATCHNIELMLQAADMTFQDIAHFKIFMEDVFDWRQIEPVCSGYLGEIRPSSTRVGIGHPAVPGMLMEIEAVAYKPRNGGPARREIRCEELYNPLGYNVDVVVCGDFAFLSGTGPLDRAGNAVGFSDPVRQSHKTLENMQIMLDAAGMGFDDVAKVVYFLENVHDLKRVNIARKEFFGANRPVSTLVGGRRCVVPGMSHVVEAIAYKPLSGGSPRREIMVPDFQEPLSHYCDGVQCGDFLFVSGQGPFDAAFVLDGTTMTDHATRVHDNLALIMSEAGFGFDDVAKVTCYMDNCDEREELNGVREKYFGASKPASTLLAVNRLALPYMKVEIDAICYQADAAT